MDSSSTTSPKKSTPQTVSPSGLKWTKNHFDHSRQLTNEPQLPNHEAGAEVPDLNAEIEEMLIDQKEVLSKHPSSEKPNLKVYFRLPDKKNKAPVERDQNPESDDPDLATTLATLASEEDEKVQKTWNLRPRKPVKKPNGEASTMKTVAPPVELKSIPEGSWSRPARSCTQNKKLKVPKMEIALTLSKEEIEQDLLALTGKKPTRRPKRRPRSLQKQLDIMTPGSFLDSLSVEAYEV